MHAVWCYGSFIALADKACPSSSVLFQCCMRDWPRIPAVLCYTVAVPGASRLNHLVPPQQGRVLLGFYSLKVFAIDILLLHAVRGT